MSKREDIQAALLTRLTASLGSNIKSSTRYYVDFGKIPPEKMPALSVICLSSSAQRDAGLPAKWTQHAMVILYVRTTNENTATPETTLFSLIEQVETALQRQPAELGSMSDDFGTTLGGLVWSCHLTEARIIHGLGEGLAAASLIVELLAYPS
jgi:hypothetical protein